MVSKKQHLLDETLRKYKKLVMNSDILCSGCVEGQLKREDLDEKKHYEYYMLQVIRALEERELEKNTVDDGHVLIDRRTGEELSVGYGVECCRYK